MWLDSVTLITIGAINIYAVDVIFLLLILLSIRVVCSAKIKSVFKDGWLYGLFLLWIFIEIIVGYTKYGFRAFGEARLIFSFLSFFVPFYLLNSKQRLNPKYIMKVIHDTILCCAVASACAYFLNMATGTVNDFVDSRGIRYIGTIHTFYLTILFCFYALKYNIVNVIKPREVAVMLFALAIAIVSKNRSALVCPIIVSTIVFVKHINVKKTVYSFVLIVLSLLMFWLIVPNNIYSEVQFTFARVLSPTTDPTGKWRLAIQAVAFQQALENFWIGQGFGGYFSFLVPGMNWDIPFEYAPHNQFLVIFLKAGIVGLLICVLTLLSFIYRGIKANITVEKNTKTSVYITVVTVIITTQIIYGLTYDFISTFGLYYGFGILLFRAIRTSSTKTSLTSTL